MSDEERLRTGIRYIIADANLYLGPELDKEALWEWAQETIQYLQQILESQIKD